MEKPGLRHYRVFHLLLCSASITNRLQLPPFLRGKNRSEILRATICAARFGRAFFQIGVACQMRQQALILFVVFQQPQKEIRHGG